MLTIRDLAAGAFALGVLAQLVAVGLPLLMCLGFFPRPDAHELLVQGAEIAVALGTLTVPLGLFVTSGRPIETDDATGSSDERQED